MVEKNNKKIEMVTYVVIIIMSLTTTILIVKKFVFPTNSTMKSLKLPVGTKIPLEYIDSQNNKILVLALSTDCSYCSKDADFYKELTTKRNNTVRVIALLPQSIDESERYLSQLGISADSIKQLSLVKIGVYATPTLILIDRNNTVLNSWVGELSSQEEKQVIEQLNK